ncbi:hypothetical protein FUAX_44730 (plasmid) [Fulvitalea axinellae]|uniref:Uncharacterized protein n=1 Tax=Fulvitalea axinellae TaxID=1182444 RepID=A0AAU9DFY6_9BACT|nr:hypothetical protein FUAX_44730 [Fulvitalea axinellae]
MELLSEPKVPHQDNQNPIHELSELVDKYIASEERGNQIQSHLLETYKNVCNSIENLEKWKEQGDLDFHQDEHEYKALIKIYWEFWDKLREHPYFP